MDVVQGPSLFATSASRVTWRYMTHQTTQSRETEVETAHCREAYKANPFLCTCCFDYFVFFFSSRRRHTRSDRDWSSDVCSSDLVLLGLGEDSAAAEDFRRALDLDPERPITLHHLGVLRIIQRRYDEALRWLDSALSVEPAFADAYPFRALSHLLLGQTPQARRDAEVAVRLAPTRYLGEAALAIVEAQEGDTLTSRRRIDDLLHGTVDSLRPTPMEGLFLGWALVSVNERKRAIDLLERAQPRGWQLSYRLRYPGFDPIRADPRFH